MRLTEFEKLGLDEKAHRLSNEGLLIQSVKYKRVALSLYYLSRFFVEVIVDINKRKIKGIKGFKNDKRLNKYLNNIEIPGF
jgi:hypothetical protein